MSLFDCFLRTRDKLPSMEAVLLSVAECGLSGTVVRVD